MKSLITNWIRKKSDKTLPSPEVMYFRFHNAGAKYYYPMNGEIYDMEGKPHSLKHGLIALHPDYHEIYDEDIAHEWRHHMQYYNGVRFNEPSKIELFKKLPYEKALRRYFEESDIELDAVRFQYKHTGVDDLWEETLYDLISSFRPRPIFTYGK